jgi:AraC-like DNA-binding protein
MFHSRLVESTDPDEFYGLIRPGYHGSTVTQRGLFKARARLIEVGRLYAQRRSEHLARVVQVDNPRPGILFLAEMGPPLFCDGAEIGYHQILMCSSDTTYLSRLSGPVSWAAMTLSANDMDAICTSYLGINPPRFSGFRVITPPDAALARLRSLHACLERPMETAGGPSEQIASQHRLEESLITAMLDTINVADVCPDTLARQHHQMIVRRFFEVLDAHPATSLNMQALSKAIGVSGRTIRMACQQQLGVSPTHYLLLGRMRLARRALQQADPALSRVTDIATELGFWELGRFAVRYHEIFGETPSTTLRACNSPSSRRRTSDYALA